MVVVALGAGAAAGPVSSPLGPQAAGAAVAGAEAIDSYAVTVEIRPSGQIHVKEVIAYQFGDTARHGILRNIPVRFHYDNRYDRIYRVRDVRVTASAGTPINLKVSDTSGNKVFRIGDPNRTITGGHTYTIEYDVDGALNPFSEHDELYWNAIGTEWSVPVAQPSVTVTAPAAITNATCFAGPQGSSSPCATAVGEGSTEVDFSNSDLPPNTAFTVVAALPKGVVSATGPILEERWSFQRAFEATPFTVTAGLALLVFGVGAVSLFIWRQGRDRRFAGGAGLIPDPSVPAGTPQEVVPPFADRAGPVAYRPPDGLRPAQLGVLLDESADPLDVTATIVDLAVRGYLMIEELERKHAWSRRDWKLTRRKPADDGLLAYERDLLESLFKGKGDEVELSDLKNHFFSDLSRIEGELYDDSVAQGWFAKRPDKVRNKYLVIGIFLTVVGAGLVVAVAATTHLGLVALPVLLVGLFLAAVHRWMPARTAKGSAALGQVLGFRRYIDTAEKDRMRFAEDENLFARYLPYAIVFGATRKWAKAFEGLDGVAQSTGSWYVSPYPFAFLAFSESMESFTDNTSGMIVSTPHSTPGTSGSSGFGGGGFSGGGGGGGGGGSW